MLFRSRKTNVANTREFVAWLKADPARGTFATPGYGGIPHLFGLKFGKSIGVPMTNVPYKGGGPDMLRDIIGGHVLVASSVLSSFVNEHKRGDVRVLATAGEARSRFVPDVPTFKEQGFPDLVATLWYGVFAAAATAAAPSPGHTFASTGKGPSGIAVDAAGKIPYFSGLRTIDMLGLNDRHIASIEGVAYRRPGHSKTDHDYVLARQPDLIAAWRTRDYDITWKLDRERYLAAGYCPRYLVYSERDRVPEPIIDLATRPAEAWADISMSWNYMVLERRAECPLR